MYYIYYYYYFLCILINFLFTYCFVAVGRPSLSKFHRDRVHRACLHVERDFHSLVTLRRLAKWGLGPEPSDEAIAHEVTIRRREYELRQISYLILFVGLVLILI